MSENEETKRQENLLSAKCRVVVGKKLGTDEDELCGKGATVYWPILAEDNVTVLDLVMACPEHDQKYEDHQTLLARDLRGFVHMFQLPLDSEETTEVQSE